MSTKVRAMNSRKINAETAAKMMVSSLVSGCRNVSLKVACAKMTVNRKKMQMERATSAEVRLRLFLSRIDGRAGNICAGSGKPGAPPQGRGEAHLWERSAIICVFASDSPIWQLGSLEFVAVEEPGFSPAKPWAIEGGFSRGARGLSQV